MKFLRKLLGPRGSWLNTRELCRYLLRRSPYHPRFSIKESTWKMGFIIWTGPAPREIDTTSVPKTTVHPIRLMGERLVCPSFTWLMTPHPNRDKIFDPHEPAGKALDRLREELGV